MLTKEPKSSFNFKKFLTKSAIILFIAEAASFVACYGVWTKLNSDRDFRNTVRVKVPAVLEAYYKFNDTIGRSNIKELDYEYWRKESKVRDN